MPVRAKFITVVLAVAGASIASSPAADARPVDPAPAKVAAACAYGHFCVTHNGRTDDYYRCGTFPVSGWTGTGYVYNNQTPGTWAELLDRNHEVWRYVPNQKGGYEDLNPVWYVKPC